MTKKPNFFIIGAPKCGTTSLAAWLAEHPQIYISPIKEPFYFSSDINNQLISTWDGYRNLFKKVSPEHLAVGEASTTYLFSQVAVPSIEEQLPGSRYIVILRNPVEMAYALHEQYFRAYNESITDFRFAWHLSPDRRAGREVPLGCKDPILLDYQSWCLLGEQLERLYGLVSHKRVLILVLDDVKEDPRREYLKILDFLEVPDDGQEYFPTHNPAREWRSPLIGRAIRFLGQWVFRAKYINHTLPKRSLGVVRFLEKSMTRQRPRPPLHPDFHAELESFFFEDIKLLERLLGCSLPTWQHHEFGSQ